MGIEPNLRISRFPLYQCSFITLPPAYSFTVSVNYSALLVSCISETTIASKRTSWGDQSLTESNRLRDHKVSIPSTGPVSRTGYDVRLETTIISSKILHEQSNFGVGCFPSLAIDQVVLGWQDGPIIH